MFATNFASGDFPSDIIIDNKSLSSKSHLLKTGIIFLKTSLFKIFLIKNHGKKATLVDSITNKQTHWIIHGVSFFECVSF